ncbi:MAG: 50S ribosomal protein L1 [Alphaproteobacteria bacterium]|nr:50S ribosomal protein L1 [Alphaproteobacteria bacterium]
MAKSGKRIRKAYEGLDPIKSYGINEALKIIKERVSAKFDETVEVAVALNVDPRKADQTVRGMVNLPNGTGKTLKVAVFARDAKAEEAKAAGADYVGEDELIDMISRGDIPFDRCIATPDMMIVVAKVGKILGPRGLMPNPKLGTVTMNVKEAVEAAKGGQIEFRAEKAGIVHAGVGKASFSEDKLAENIKALMEALKKAKPETVKGTYINRVNLSSTMGPGVRVDLISLAN